MGLFFLVVIEYFNITCFDILDKPCNPKTKAFREPIAARLNDGNSIDDCKTVIGKMYKNWIDDPKMKNYIRITTLFKKSKFPEYLSMKTKGGEQFNDEWADDFKKRLGND